MLGGPTHYTERHGGYPHMVSRHRGRAIKPEQRARRVELMLTAMDEVGLSEDAQFRPPSSVTSSSARAARWPTPSRTSAPPVLPPSRSGAGAGAYPVRSDPPAGGAPPRPGIGNKCCPSAQPGSSMGVTGDHHDPADRRGRQTGAHPP
ncbi:hypothetical protein ACIP8Z_29380 [Streptomyces sp. NPDC088553]|uniref:globin domain-containing protein n=1 Tax=Streptomyces sp. NPDC088553 TaxID=3365864 RepID=UPI0038014B54